MTPATRLAPPRPPMPPEGAASHAKYSSAGLWHDDALRRRPAHSLPLLSTPSQPPMSPSSPRPRTLRRLPHIRNKALTSRFFGLSWPLAPDPRR
ncbi:unnamed protein product, partial [Ilex paraguariensis]